MTTPRVLHATALIIVLTTASRTWAQSHGSSGGSSTAGSGQSSGSGGSSIPHVSGAVSSGWARYYPFYITTVGPSGMIYSYIPPQFSGPGVLPPGAVPAPMYDPGTVAPLPPPGLIRPQPARPVVKVRRGDAGRSAQALTLGDRMFRIENWKRAEERYLQAARHDPDAAAPRVRLAQIAIVREQYREAADRLREAEVAQPGWIATARDVEAIYAEPADFARRLAKIQSHLHTHPDDRDAWLVLGAQWYLSNRAGQAADVFRRLDDPHRRPDVVLAAFLDATNQPRAAKPVPEPPAVGDPFKAPEGEP